MTLRSIVQAFFIAFAVRATESRACGIIESSPGVVRVSDGATASFVWHLRRPRLAGFTVSMCADGECEPLIQQDKPSLRPIVRRDYRERVRIHPLLNEISFTLLNVTERDTHYDYGLEIHRKLDLCYDVAGLFIYRKPSKPIMKLQSQDELPEGITANLTCSSTSRSVPHQYRQELVYSWVVGGTTVDQLHSGKYEKVGDKGQALIIRHSGPDDDVITCTAKEPGSPISSHSHKSLSTTAINKKDKNKIQSSTKVVSESAGPTTRTAWIDQEKLKIPLVVTPVISVSALAVAFVALYRRKH